MGQRWVQVPLITFSVFFKLRANGFVWYEISIRRGVEIAPARDTNHGGGLSFSCFFLCVARGYENKSESSV